MESTPLLCRAGKGWANPSTILKRSGSVRPRNLGLMVFTTVALVACNRKKSSARNVAEIGSKMSLLIQQHRFGETAQLLRCNYQTWLIVVICLISITSSRR
jgi:hypothetical protein